MKAVYALYSTPDSAQAAWSDLRAAGIDADAITVVSSEPFEDYEFGDHHAATWMYWIAGCGGAPGRATDAFHVDEIAERRVVVVRRVGRHVELDRRGRVRRRIPFDRPATDPCRRRPGAGQVVLHEGQRFVDGSRDELHAAVDR